MLRVQYELSSPVERETLLVLLEALVRLNVQWLRRQPRRIPSVYQTGIRYAVQPNAPERFLTIPALLGRMRADCDQLAAWRVAELIAAGEPATIDVRRMGPRMWHVFVRRASGAIEDVSARLGMGVPREMVVAGNRIRKRKGLE